MTEWTDWHEKHSDKIELVAGIDCWIWNAAQGGGGYGRVRYIDRAEFAHRAAFIEAGGDFSAGNIVRHMCGNRLCVRPSHLKAGTQADNSRDMSEMFQSKCSTSLPTVLGIRKDYAAGMPLSEISSKYNMAQGSIVQVASGRVYRTIAPETIVKPNRFPRKLDPEKAEIIRQMIADGATQSSIAKKFSVAQSVVSRINTGARWATDGGSQ
jgi:hypothetical protein